MEYLYYPGCSLQGTALEYDISTRALMKAIGAQLIEIEDWTCCGATSAESISYLLSLALPARNLALAEAMNKGLDILVPCSACYLNLKKVEDKIKKEPDLYVKIEQILKEDNLELKGKTKIRHLLDVLSLDIGPEKIKKQVKKTLKNLKIAPYYGCQCLRPYPVFDDPEKPVSMQPLIKAIGCTVHLWDMGGKCCGASNMNTKMEVGLGLVTSILKRAKGADAIVTVCPMCQMNLEAYQKKISSICNENLNITILYLPQLLGLAIGLSPEELGINLNLSVTKDFSQIITEL